jgi:hypothetical protein
MTLKSIRTFVEYEAPWVLLPTYSGFNTNPGVFLISAPLARADKKESRGSQALGIYVLTLVIYVMVI